MAKAYDLEKVCTEIAKKRDVELEKVSTEEFFGNKNIRQAFVKQLNSVSEDEPGINVLIGKDDQFFFAYYGYTNSDEKKTELMYIEDSNRKVISYRHVPMENDFLMIANKDYVNAMKLKEIRNYFSDQEFVHDIRIQDKPKNKPIYLLLDRIIEDKGEYQEDQPKKENKYSIKKVKQAYQKYKKRKEIKKNSTI